MPNSPNGLKFNYKSEKVVFGFHAS